MTLLLIGLAGLAAYLNSGSGTFGIATANAVGSFWANGVLANFRDDRQAAPNWAATVSLITTICAVVFIIIGLANG